MRPYGKFWPIALLLCVWPLGASADDNEAAKLISECSAQDLPQRSVDSCLERARVLEETEPSTGLQSLEAALARRAGRGPSGISTARAEPAAAPPAGPPSPAAAPLPTDSLSDEHTVEAPTGSDRLAGPDADDQPPIADPDDEPRPDGSEVDQPDSPE